MWDFSRFSRGMKSLFGGDSAGVESSGSDGFVVSFGEPESVLDQDVTSYFGTFLDPRDFWLPPIDKTGLIKTRSANGFHSRMPLFRRDKVLNLYQKHPLISRKELGLAIENLLVTGDGYLGVQYNAFQQPVGLFSLPSVNMRIRPLAGSRDFRFCYVQNGRVVANFYEHEVIHLCQDDLLDSVYGVPEYYGAIQSVLLNEAATLFRRKYFINGAHLGSLFLSTSSQLSSKDEKKLAEKIRQSKGVGNWRSMFINFSGENRKVDDVFKIIPVGDVAARDEFDKIKKITDYDISAAWGTRPEVAGIMPEGYGNTGDLEKLHALDFENKTLPLINMISDAVNAFFAARYHLTFAEPRSLVLPSQKVTQN